MKMSMPYSDSLNIMMVGYSILSVVIGFKTFLWPDGCTELSSGLNNHHELWHLLIKYLNQ